MVGIEWSSRIPGEVSIPRGPLSLSFSLSLSLSLSLSGGRVPKIVYQFELLIKWKEMMS